MNQELWNNWFPDTQMPADCTYQQFWAAQDAYLDELAIESTVEALQEVEDQLVQFSHNAALTELLRTSQSILKRELSDAKL